MKARLFLDIRFPVKPLAKVLAGVASSAILTCLAGAAEYHVAVTGNDANDGSAGTPFKTISATANVAQPGDTVTVHAGVYRERVNPPRGGTSDTNRITYQAAPGEAVTIKGSEIVTGWTYLSNDTWTVTLPYSFFGGFNPFNNMIIGDWFTAGNGGNNHTAQVYLNGDWLIEASSQAAALQPASGTAKWTAQVDAGGTLMNIERFQLFTGATAGTNLDASLWDTGSGVIDATSSEGGNCVGYIEDGDWTRYANVVFGTNADSIQIRAASPGAGGRVEVRLNNSTGTLLGVCTVTNTGGWQTWMNFTASITPTSGTNTVCLVYRFPAVNTGSTTIWAQFPGKNPNNELVEVNARQTVFYPDQTNINYITVRGFTLEQGAPPWAPPTAEQMGLIGPHWSKGWIIESNNICYSSCCGVSLGKYGDHWDNTATTTANSSDAYVQTINRAETNGWNKATVGSHLVRGNQIYNCEQTGIVGSLGAVFSTITGNHIHDIHVRGLFGGEEMAGIKIHGAIDVQILHNHIHNCGNYGGIWLDWMAQGTHISENLFHDNSSSWGDLFFEVDHGPILIDHNLLLSGQSVQDTSEGEAYVHNLIAGTITVAPDGVRQTPYLVPHDTAIVGLTTETGGDTRFYNNLVVAPTSLAGYNSTAHPVTMDGDVFLNGAGTSTKETSPLVLPSFNPALQVVAGFGGYYLKMNADPAWGTNRTRQLVTTALLGNAIVPNEAFEQPDGMPWVFNTDYFGAPRNTNNPFPGPFESPVLGTNVWKVFNDASVSAPVGLTATAGMSKVLLNWSTFYGAASYNVKRASVSGGPYTTVASGLTNTAWADANVTNGVAYFYVISASDGVSEGANSAEVSATPQASLAINCGGAASGNFAADAWYSTGSTYSSGTAVSTNGVANAAPPAVYQSERWGVLTYTVPGLNPGTKYLVRLHFAEIYFTTAGSRVWNVLVNGAIVLTNFDAFVAAGGANKAVVREVTAAADTNGQITISLATVVSNPKISGFEVLPLTIPATPTGLTAATGFGQVNLNWSASTGASAYRVWRSGASNGTYTVIGSTPATQFADGNVTNGATYFYSVTATNSLGESTNSPPVGVTVVIPSGTIWTNRANGSWNVAGNWLSNTIPNGVGAVANFDTLTLASNVTVTLDSSPTVGGLLFGDAGNLYSWIVNAGSGGTLTLKATNPPVIQVDNQTATVGAVLAGTNGLTKAGAGTLALNATNTFTGGVTINAGTLSLNNAGSLNSTLSNSVTLNGSNATLQVVNYRSTIGLVTVVAGVTGVNLAANNTSATAQTGYNLYGIILNSPLTITYTRNGSQWLYIDNWQKITGPGGGSGNDSLIFVQTGTSGNPYFQFDAAASNDFIGNVHVKSGNWAVQAFNSFVPGTHQMFPTGCMLILDSGTTWTWNNASAAFVQTVDGLSGSGTMSKNAVNYTLTINANNSANDATRVFSGNLSSPAGTLTLGGTGKQTFAGANINYTIPTAVNGGALLLSNCTAFASAVTVNTDATFGGTGTSSAAVTVNGGGTLAPGLPAAMGTLNVGGALTLNSGSTNVLRINRTSGVLTNDQVRLTGVSGVTYNGTLAVVSNANSEAFQAGDTFRLFPAPGYAGGFAAISLPSLPANLTWVTSSLTVDGSISVVDKAAVGMPSFSPPPGTYGGAQAVTITSDAGATIYYTTNGTTPTNTSTLYTGPVNAPVNTTMTIKAYATKAGLNDSPVASATYQTQSMPLEWNQLVFVNVDHAPVGACSTLAYGYKGDRCGLGLSTSVIPYSGGGGGVVMALAVSNQIQALPFVASTASIASGASFFADSDVRRMLTPCTDEWTVRSGALTLTHYTPAWRMDRLDQATLADKKRFFLPATWMVFTGNNTNSVSEDFYFGLPAAAVRTNYANGAYQGFAVGEAAFAVQTGSCELLSGASLTAALDGMSSGFAFHLNVPAGQTKSLTVAVTYYRTAAVDTRLGAPFYYTTLFGSMDAVVDAAFAGLADAQMRCTQLAGALSNAGLNVYRQFLTSHALHAYQACTVALTTANGILWREMEGFYTFVNTCDLMVDHAFYDSMMCPWALRNVLDTYSGAIPGTGYTYTHSLYDLPTGNVVSTNGFSFHHDMGGTMTSEAPGTDPTGYESGFSYMGQEELQNWILSAGLYWGHSADDAWLTNNATLLQTCLNSMLLRDDTNAPSRDGITTYINKRGSNQEITTYDSLDASLNVPRLNAYSTVRNWASYLSLEAMFNRVGDTNDALTCHNMAAACAQTIVNKWNAYSGSLGYIPAFLDGSNTSAIIPILEGLSYPGQMGLTNAVDRVGGPYARMLLALSNHISAVLVSGKCLDATSGGWKLTSANNNTWQSKVYLSQYVTEKVLGISNANVNGAVDQIHAMFQINEAPYQGWSDQLNSAGTGGATGSMHYPRGITSALWWMNTTNNPAYPVAVSAPVAPTGLSALAGNGQVTLLWNGAALASGYNLKRATASGRPYLLVTNLSSVNFTDTGLTNGVPYYYVVTATNQIGESLPSAEVSATPYLPPPSGLAAQVGNHSVSLGWSAVSSATGYVVQRATVSGGSYTPLATNSATAFVDGAARNGTTYYYVVAAVFAGGQSGNSAEVGATPLVTLPLYSANCGANAVGRFAADGYYTSGAAYSASMTVSTNGVLYPAPPSVYQSERYSTASTFSYTFTNLVPGVNYLLRLHFAEIYFTTAGQRVFNIFVNGTGVLNNFDIIAQAGSSNQAVVKEFTLPAAGSGQLVVLFSNVVQNAKVSGLEILPAGALLPNTGTNLALVVGGANFTLSWPSNYVGWIVQTNAAALWNSAGWGDVPGSETGLQFTVPLGGLNLPQEFFRLRHP
jgi:autotransporter-associated beta strand protein